MSSSSNISTAAFHCWKLIEELWKSNNKKIFQTGKHHSHVTSQRYVIKLHHCIIKLHHYIIYVTLYDVRPSYVMRSLKLYVFNFKNEDVLMWKMLLKKITVSVKIKKNTFALPVLALSSLFLWLSNVFSRISTGTWGTKNEFLARDIITLYSEYLHKS